MSELDMFSPEVIALENLWATFERCGSRVTCSPPPDNSDEDWLVVIPPHRQNVADAVGHLSSQGYQWEGSEHYQDAAASDFMSWRKGAVNLIVTASEQFATRHRAATALCKRLNLMSKQDRIAVFQAVLYANIWTTGDPK